MKRLQGFKFRLKPNGAQLKLMRQFAGNARKVWNLALAQQKASFEAGNKFVTSFGMNEWLLSWKKDLPYLKDSPSQTLQQVTKDVERAFKNFFQKRAAYPKFKKKGKNADSFRYPQGILLEQENQRIFLPKLGWLRYRKSRQIVGTIKNVTVSHRAGHWYVAIQTEQDILPPVPTAKTAVGLDVGIAKLVTLSDGTVYLPLNSYRQQEQRLAFLQRKLSHKIKFSANWHKAKAKVQRCHQTIANSRKDFLHKTSHEISKNHAMIFIEDLQIQNMSHSASGTKEEPGKQVKAKSGLNKAILDQGWFELRRQLDYKQQWRGGQMIALPARNTSRKCAACGYIAADNRKTQAQFACGDCGYCANADLNAARNLLAAGHAVLARGESALLGCSMKREPTEELQAVA